jgi:uncharacterized repeat protein (TIGR01451 family)
MIINRLFTTVALLSLPVAIGAQPLTRPTTLEATSATSQQAPAGANVTSAPTVRVLNKLNDPLSGIDVVFTVTSGGGSVTPSTVTTLGTGVAQLTSWRLGALGVNTVTATVRNLEQGQPLPAVTFNATGVLAATTVQPAAPLSITGLAGLPVPQPPAVRVNDQFGKPLRGATVTFAVTVGGGSIEPAALPTALDGVARLKSWTLGQNSGTNKVTATVGALAPVEFTAVTPFKVTASVKRADGASIASTYVCIGLRRDLDEFATVRDAGTDGQETFSVPAASEYAVTASKAGFVGRTEFVGASGHAAAVTLTLAEGTGGAVCPNTPYEATESAAPTILRPDLDVKVKQSSNPLVAGTQQTYSVKVHNVGAETASSIVVKHSLPADLTFVSNRSDRGFSCSRAGTALTCSNGTVAVRDSATFTIVMSLPLAAASGHDILFNVTVDPDKSIVESNETNNEGAAATTTAAVRLGEEILSVHGWLTVATLGAERMIKQLDCNQFGASFVMVGIEGNGTTFIERLLVQCSDMQRGGTLNTSVRKTESFFLTTTPSALKPFERRCPSGFAVSGVQGSLAGGVVVSLMLHCRAIAATGRTSGTVGILGPTTSYGPTSWGPDPCPLSRPARALKVGATSTIGDLFNTIPRIVGTQLVCEQPVVP